MSALATTTHPIFMGSLEPKAVQLARLEVNAPVIDYFLDTLAYAVASATIGQPYKVAFQLKTHELSTYVARFIKGAPKDLPFHAQILITAIVYLTRIQTHLIASINGPFLCERIATGALLVASKVRRVLRAPRLTPELISGSRDQYTYDVSMKASLWKNAAHNFTTQEVIVMERDFLLLIDHRTHIIDTHLLAHYDALRERCIAHNDAQRLLWYQHSIFAHRKPSEPRVVVESPPVAALPELTYPDSPSSDVLSSDEFSDIDMDEDGYDDEVEVDLEYSSDESPEIITPPNTLAQPEMAAAGSIAAKVDAHHYPYPTPPYTLPQPQIHHQQGFALSRNAAMDARIRFYAADRGRTTIEAGNSPRYIPYSPSLDQPPIQPQPQPQPQAQQLQHAAHAKLEGYCPHAACAPQYPWRMQQWQSSLSSDKTWGNLGFW
ncbi:hypothetical protein C8Q76DRAFT_399546 [Earliella scabrosa]|nr:hypothetical protein C8Q76DRAFT_399546 [Earliella scabrosa]